MGESVRAYTLPQLRRGEKILIAFSAGLDSRVLMELLYERKEEYQLQLALFHLDHALRPSSAEEAMFAAELAREKGLPFFFERQDVEGYCRQRGLGIEEGARELRYQRLREKKEELGFDVIATGHHLDDNIETFFLNLARGSGLQGLRGMDVRRGDLYRPLLSIRKKELEQIAEERGFSFVTDESNLQGDYTRNRWRLELLPKMEQLSPSIFRTIHRAMEHIRREDDFLEKQTEELDEKLERPWKLDALQEVDEALLYRLIRRRIQIERGSLRDISADGIERVAAIIKRKRGRVEIQGYHFLASQGKLYFVKAEEKSSEGYQELLLGRNDLLGTSFLLKETFIPEYGDDVLSIPKEMVKGSLYIRTRKDGDRFSPSGMKGSKKLKDYLIDEKVPFPLRDSIALVCDDETIYWVVGYRKADIPRESDGKYLVLRRLDVVPKEDN